MRRALGRHARLVPGDLVVVAVSGGADSVALLVLLRELAGELDVRLHAVHVDHGLRPDSGRDAEFVRTLAARLGVPLEVVAVQVARTGSREAAARAARHGALEAAAARLDAAWIALGHTADDQAETVLMRVLSGAGVRGLAGIPPRRGRLIRPLLGCRHAELAAELARRGFAWVEDPTNRDLAFLRNRMRHVALPALAAAGGVDPVPGLCRVAASARRRTDACEEAALRALDRLAAPGAGGLVLPRAPLTDLPPEVAVETLRLAVARLGGPGMLRAWAYRGLARMLADPAPRGVLSLGPVTLEASGSLVRVSAGDRPSARRPRRPSARRPRRPSARRPHRPSARGPQRPSARRPLGPVLEERRLAPSDPQLGDLTDCQLGGLAGRVELEALGRGLEARLRPAAGYVLPAGPERVAFDADALPGPLAVRTRRAGDRFAPFGGAGGGGAGDGRLKSFLARARVPRWERDRTPLVTAGSTIVWVAGVRRGAAAPVGPGTRQVLELALVD